MDAVKGWTVELPAEAAILDGTVERGDRWIIGGVIEEVVATVHGSERIDVEKVAPLIAAAPEMRESLAAIVNAYDGPTVDAATAVSSHIQRARMALAKANGKQIDIPQEAQS